MSIKCITNRCTRKPLYNQPNQNIGLYCRVHKNESMVNVKNKKIPCCTICVKTVGLIGEYLPVQEEFINIKNLNQFKANFPVFDIVAEKDNVTYVFTAKGRNKYNKNGKLNERYNLLSGSGEYKKQKLEKSLKLLKENGYDTDSIIYCFLIVPVEKNKDCIYYWGLLTDIRQEYTIKNILDNNLKKNKSIGVKTSDCWLEKYNKFGCHKWQDIADKYNLD